MTTSDFRLKQPVLIYIIGLCFIVSPPVNMAFGLYLFGDPGWNLPSHWFTLFLGQDLFQIIMLSLVPVAGVLLLIKNKTSWFFAGIILLTGCLQNIYAYFSNETIIVPPAVPLLTNFSLLVLFFYFRFPYLDRRDKIFHGVSHRIPSPIPVIYDSKQFSARNLSRNGCLLEFPSAQTLPQVDSPIEITIDGTTVKGTVLRHEGKGCAIRFDQRLSTSKMDFLRSSYGK